MDAEGFKALLERVAVAWSSLDIESAVDCFTPDAVYMEPPDIQLYVGHDDLRPYFAALAPGTIMRFENVWFDEENRVGAGEYTFGLTGQDTADHGVAVIEVRDDRIHSWREYQRKGPLSMEDFLSRDKNWEWHIGNYP